MLSDPTRPGLRWLGVVAVVETVSLMILLANRATSHLPVVASIMGPVHGFAYLATIALAFLVPLSTGTRLLALMPIVGGLMTVWRARSTGPGAAAGEHHEQRGGVADDRLRPGEQNDRP